MKAIFVGSFWAPIKETFDWWASTILVKWQGGCYQVTPRYLVKFVYKMDLSFENFSQHPSVGFPEVFLLPNHVRISSSSQTFRDGKEKNWQNFDQSVFGIKNFPSFYFSRFFHACSIFSDTTKSLWENNAFIFLKELLFECSVGGRRDGEMILPFGWNIWLKWTKW